MDLTRAVFVTHTLLIILLVSLSEWSEWTPCSPCVPASSLLHSDSAMGDGGGISGHIGMPETALVSVQRRYRTCLDVDSGLPVTEREGECSKPLQEERICPQPDVCKGDRVSLTHMSQCQRATPAFSWPKHLHHIIWCNKNFSYRCHDGGFSFGFFTFSLFHFKTNFFL